MNRIDGLCVTDKGRLGLVPLEGLTKAELKTAGANLAHVVVGNPGLVEHAPVVERLKQQIALINDCVRFRRIPDRDLASI